MMMVIAQMIEAVQTAETSVNSYQCRYNPEDSHLLSHRRENLKSYLTEIYLRIDEICQASLSSIQNATDTLFRT
jgi:hypothetical protein